MEAQIWTSAEIERVRLWLFVGSLAKEIELALSRSGGLARSTASDNLREALTAVRPKKLWGLGILGNPAVVSLQTRAGPLGGAWDKFWFLIIRAVFG